MIEFPFSDLIFLIIKYLIFFLLKSLIFVDSTCSNSNNRISFQWFNFLNHKFLIFFFWNLNFLKFSLKFLRFSSCRERPRTFSFKTCVQTEKENSKQLERDGGESTNIPGNDTKWLLRSQDELCRIEIKVNNSLRCIKHDRNLLNYMVWKETLIIWFRSRK